MAGGDIAYALIPSLDWFSNYSHSWIGIASVTHALVASHLDYCNVIYVRLPLKIVLRLQLIQKAAARLISGAT